MLCVFVQMCVCLHRFLCRCFLSPLLFLLPLAQLLPAVFLLLDQGQWMSFGLLCGPGGGGLDVWVYGEGGTAGAPEISLAALCRTRQLRRQEAVIRTRGGLTLRSFFSSCLTLPLSLERNAPTLRDQSS